VGEHGHQLHCSIKKQIAFSLIPPLRDIFFFFLKQPHENNGTIFFTDQKRIVMKKAYLTLLTVLTSIILFAQEKTTQVDVDVNKTTSSSNWYASPWVWIVGAAVFILLLVALTSGSRDTSDRVVEKRTVIRDTDV
jgi:hypothetical protein